MAIQPFTPRLFVCQTDAGVENANAYADVDFADNYLTLRGRFEENGWNALTPMTKRAYLIAGTDYTDKVHTFYGVRKTHDDFVQDLGFPRIPLAGQSLPFGKSVPVGVPLNVRQCCVELAVRVARYGELFKDIETTSDGQDDVTSTEDFTSTVTEGTVKAINYGEGEGIEFFAPGTTHRNSTFTDHYSRIVEGFRTEPYPAASHLLKEYTVKVQPPAVSGETGGSFYTRRIIV